MKPLFDIKTKAEKKTVLEHIKLKIEEARNAENLLDLRYWKFAYKYIEQNY